MKKTVLVAIVLIIMIFSFTGCEWPNLSFNMIDNNTYYETEYFMCDISWNEIRIGGLTQAGKLLEEMVIPTEIDGKQVRVIGYLTGWNYFGSANLKKLFIPEGIKTGRPELMRGMKPNLIFLSIKPNFENPRTGSLGGGGRVCSCKVFR